MRVTFLLFLFLVFHATASLAESAPQVSSRPFHMGFTRWPPDFTQEAVQTVDSFISKHADLVSLHLDNGIPWPESLEGKPYSQDVMKRLSYRPPSGYKLYVAINPLDMGRDKMASYWGEKDNMPLPAGWQNLSLSDPKIIRAYINYAIRVVDATKPDYFVIGVEVNELISNTPDMWPGYVALHKATYMALKARYPSLPIFASFNVLHWKGIADKSDKDTQERLIREIIPYVDMIGLSYYPFMSYDSPNPIPDDYLSFATKFGKPVAVTETGYTTENVMVFFLPLFGSEKKQIDYYRFLFKTALRDKYVMVITFCTTDFEKLASALPDPLGDLAGIWKYTGLQTSGLEPKQALSLWDGVLHLPYRQ